MFFPAFRFDPSSGALVAEHRAPAMILISLIMMLIWGTTFLRLLVNAHYLAFRAILARLRSIALATGLFTPFARDRHTFSARSYIRIRVVTNVYEVLII